MSNRRTTGSSMPSGSVALTLSMADRTSSVAFCGSAPTANSTVVADSPRDTVELTWSTLAMLDTAPSISRVTCVSTSDGAAPASVTATCTIGNDTSGKSLMGNAA